MPDAKQFESRVKKSQFFYLLAALILLLAVTPFFENRYLGRILHLVFLTAVFIAAVVANRHRRRVFIAGIVIAVIAIPLNWSGLLFREDAVSLARYAVAIIFLGMTAAMVLISVLNDHSASVGAIIGAMCVYLLLGLTWALAYSAIEHMQPESFDVLHRRTDDISQDGHERTAFSQFIYFSFVTMSTLGYGDITPRTALAETATWMQSVTGVFYLAVLVSRLVSALPQPSRDN